MEEKIVKFHQFVLKARRCHDYQLRHILNMDETPMRFELPATRTLELTSNWTVPILLCSGDKQSFTVILAVKANGEKLPPKVIFKGVRQPRIQIPPRMQVLVPKKGWMDEEGIYIFLFIYFSIKKLFGAWISRNCDIIHIMFPKHVLWHFWYASNQSDSSTF